MRVNKAAGEHFAPLLLYTENHAIVAWFKKALPINKMQIKNQQKKFFVPKAPSGGSCRRRATEGVLYINNC